MKTHQTFFISSPGVSDGLKGPSFKIHLQVPPTSRGHYKLCSRPTATSVAFVVTLVVTDLPLRFDYAFTTLWLQVDYAFTTLWLQVDYAFTTLWLQVDYALTTLWLQVDYAFTTL